MHVLAYALGLPMKATEKAQQQLVDSALGFVERTLAHQQTVRKAIKESRGRVDDMLTHALKAARPEGAG